ncbi:hypothetical protein ACK8GG_08640 [Micromonosporaceae bacterium DT55]|uniref:hypothetical protein n=1 Tax=Melissospora conviva TaxID=3388432 RepID=UPI003C150776
MTSPRRRRVAAAALAGFLALGGCGPGDGAVPSADAPPSAAAIATATADADGFTSAEREVLNAVKGFHDVVFAPGDIRDRNLASALKGIVTEQVYKDAVAFERKQEGLVRLGTYSFEPFTVTINGDEAEVHGCFDGTSSFMVKRGETQPGVGSKPGDRRENEITLERVDGVWLVSFPFANGKPC